MTTNLTRDEILKRTIVLDGRGPVWMNGVVATYLSGGRATTGELCAAVRAARELRERLDAAIENMESIIAEDWETQSAMLTTLQHG